MNADSLEQDLVKLANGDENEVIALIVSMCVQYHLGFRGKSYEQMKPDFLNWFKSKGMEVNNFQEEYASVNFVSH
jgi:hypothetical protein